MAVSNYSLTYAHAPAPFTPAISPAVINSQLDDLLYAPNPQDDSPARENEPFSQPRKNKKKRGGSHYLPPQNHYTHYPREPSPPYVQSQLYNNPRLSVEVDQHRVRNIPSPYEPTAGQYVHDPSGDYDATPGIPPGPSVHTPPQPAPDYTYSNFQNYHSQQNYFQSTSQQSHVQHSQIHPHTPAPPPAHHQNVQPPHQYSLNPQKQLDPPRKQGHVRTRAEAQTDKPPGFTKVEPGSGGSNTKTQIHAVLDYDDYYDDVPGNGGVNVAQASVTPLQGPILVKNGSVPVVPLYSYPTVNNGSYYQIPILWTALSLALGYELQGQIIKGVPCVKRNYQLYCPTAGNTYPLEKIESFIDENKALMKRMYGAFGSGPAPGRARKRRAPGVPDPHPASGDSYFRHVRQTNMPPPPLTPSQGNSSNRIDACESKTEIITPYWALNSARKLRAVVNTMHFEQAIHQEVCSKTTTARCAGDCGCEQKYKWHRLLAYDPEEDCSGIFMDWFLFPSCCVCRCNP